MKLIWKLKVILAQLKFVVIDFAPRLMNSSSGSVLVSVASLVTAIMLIEVFGCGRIMGARRIIIVTIKEVWNNKLAMYFYLGLHQELLVPKTSGTLLSFKSGRSQNFSSG